MAKTMSLKKQYDKNETVNLEPKIHALLTDLGITPHLKGYHYLKDALLLVILDYTYLSGVTKCLYPEIAKKNKTTWHRVERAMRHAIERTNTEFTNKEFISVYAEKLRLGLI